LIIEALSKFNRIVVHDHETAVGCDAAGLIERQPDNAAGSVTAVAVRWLIDGASQLPFLRFITPLGYGVRDDIV
jgi:hypothetical protein